MIACDMLHMPDNDAMARLRQNLTLLMEQKGIKPTTLSMNIRKSNPSLVADLLSKTTDVKLSTLESLSEQLGVPVDRLLLTDLKEAPVGPTLAVKGVVSAGFWVEAFEQPEDDWQTMTGRPDVSASVTHRFFLRVQGDSMDHCYPDGTFIECVHVLGGAEIAEGKRVVVLRRRKDLMYEATVKEYVVIDGEKWCVPRSSNPRHQPFRLDVLDQDIVDIRIIATVVGSVRPE